MNLPAIDCLLTRRSVREFTGEALQDHQIETLLRAGMAAPSAGNGRPWHFIVIREQATLGAIERVHPHSKMLRKAGQAIALCADTTRPGALPGYFQQDMGACAQNILLCAHAMGLGAVWLGVYPYPERVAPLRGLFCLPEGTEPFCVIAVGVPSKTPPPADRFEQARIRQERW